MPFHIRDPETDALLRALARRRGAGLTEAVREAVRRELERELEREEEKPSLWERTADIRARLNAHPDTGFKADKAFYDRLSGEEDI